MAWDVFLTHQIASLQSPLELVLNLGYSNFRSRTQNRQWGFQVHLTSAASVNFLVLAVPPVVFAFPWTSLLELLVLHFVLSVSPICSAVARVI